MGNLAICSGGFDPLHKGHVEMIEHAAHIGDVIAIINSDEWLIRKKGKVFMPFQERAYIVSVIKGVKRVIDVDDSDDTVCKAIQRIADSDATGYDLVFYCNGGDREAHNVPELALCEILGILPIFKIGGGKSQSSSDLLKRWTEEG